MKQVDDVLRGDRYGAAPNDKRRSGIWAQIDENRAILELLKIEAPGLLEAHPEIESSFAHRDAWLTDLAEAAEIRNSWWLSKPCGWPRPWPGAEEAPTDMCVEGM